MIPLAEIFLQAAAQGDQRRARERDDKLRSEQMGWQREDRQREQDQSVADRYRAEDMQQAQAQAFRGSPGLLMQMDPGAAAKLDQEQRAQQGKVDAEQRARRTAALKINYDRTLAANPALAPRLQQHVAELVRTGQIDPFEPAKSQEPTTLAQQITEATGYKPGTPAFRQAMQAAMKKSQGGGININVGQGGTPGAVGLTTPNQTRVQDDVGKARLRTTQLDNIEKAVTAAGGYDAFGSYLAAGKGAIAEMQSKAGLGGDRDALRKRAAAEGAIAGFTNPVISELSGANVPPSEFDRIKKSLPVVDDAGPVLEEKVRAWRENLRIIETQGIDALVNGIRTGQVMLPGENKSPAPKAQAPAARAQPTPQQPKPSAVSQTVSAQAVQAATAHLLEDDLPEIERRAQAGDPKATKLVEVLRSRQ